MTHHRRPNWAPNSYGTEERGDGTRWLYVQRDGRYQRIGLLSGKKPFTVRSLDGRDLGTADRISKAVEILEGIHG